jgi:hypothetical protein
MAQFRHFPGAAIRYMHFHIRYKWLDSAVFPGPDPLHFPRFCFPRNKARETVLSFFRFLRFLRTRLLARAISFPAGSNSDLRISFSIPLSFDPRAFFRSRPCVENPIRFGSVLMVAFLVAMGIESRPFLA